MNSISRETGIVEETPVGIGAVDSLISDRCQVSTWIQRNIPMARMNFTLQKVNLKEEFTLDYTWVSLEAGCRAGGCRVSSRSDSAQRLADIQARIMVATFPCLNCKVKS